MSAVAIPPSATPALPPCAWCGLRVSIGRHEATDCCRECKDGGRAFRVKMAMGRWKRAKEQP